MILAQWGERVELVQAHISWVLLEADEGNSAIAGLVLLFSWARRAISPLRLASPISGTMLFWLWACGGIPVSKQIRSAGTTLSYCLNSNNYNRANRSSAA